MKLEMTWGGLARRAGGRLTVGEPGDRIEALVTDTRKLDAGQAFWALKGERVDAHDLLTADLAKKTSGWIVETGRPVAAKAAHVVEVPDTLKALQALAANHRRRFEIPVVGITGSNGKTTTKEMLRGICARVAPTCATPGNWNNQLGVPLSVLELQPVHRYAVFELADSHPGDIDEVAKIAQPTVGVVTNLGADHLEFYGSMEANFKTKAELIDNLPDDGKAVINLDDPWLAGLEPRLAAKAVTFGMSPNARVSFDEEGNLLIDRHKVAVKLRAFGRLSRYNAAAAAAAAWAVGIDVESIRAGLEDYRPSAMRLEILRHASGCPVVLDAYNANPDSMRASIEAFCLEYASARKVLALGDMKELGKDSGRFHAELGRWLAGLPLAGVYLAGPEMRLAADELSAAKPAFGVHHAAEPQAWLSDLKKSITKDHAVFIKASRAMKFETIVEAL